MLSAALFDMDGLLVDSEPLWREAEVQVFSAYGVPLREADCETTSGLRLDEVVAHWKRHFAFDAVSDAVLVEQIVEAVVALLREKVVAKPGVAEVLDRVHARGWKVALASSSATRIIDAAIDTIGIGHRFHARISAHGLEHGKPHPAVFLKAAATLGVDPTSCIVFEDSMFGVVAARAARMACIAVPDAHQKGDPRYVIADATLDTLALVTDELLDRLDRSRGFA